MHLLQEAFVDLSVSETLFKLVMIGNYKKASKLQSEFKIPANRFWHLKVAALAKRGKWDTLQRFANEKKSPIGYKVRHATHTHPHTATVAVASACLFMA